METEEGKERRDGKNEKCIRRDIREGVSGDIYTAYEDPKCTLECNRDEIQKYSFDD